MSPNRDPHIRTPVPSSCGTDACPVVTRYEVLEGQVNEILALINGKGEAVGLKGTVDRHERIFQLSAKFGVGVAISCVACAIIFAVSTLAFTATANNLRAEMHQDSVQQTQIK